MKKTLYDLLELSQSASTEAISASYQRHLAKILDGDPDADNKRIVLNEAFSTLSQPARRERYDKTLAGAGSAPEIIIYENKGGWSGKHLVIGALLIGIVAFGYNKNQKDKEALLIEKERVMAAERMAAIQKAEEDTRREENNQRIAQARLERQQQYEQEAARRQGAQISASNAYAEERSRREADAQARQQQRDQENAQRRQDYEAQNRLTRDKAQLRQLESENNRYRRFSVN